MDEAADDEEAGFSLLPSLDDLFRNDDTEPSLARLCNGTGDEDGDGDAEVSDVAGGDDLLP